MVPGPTDLRVMPHGGACHSAHDLGVTAKRDPEARVGGQARAVTGATPADVASQAGPDVSRGPDAPGGDT